MPVSEKEFQALLALPENAAIRKLGLEPGLIPTAIEVWLNLKQLAGAGKIAAPALTMIGMTASVGAMGLFLVLAVGPDADSR